MAADISATMASLSSTEGSNQPTGSTSISTNLDDNQRMLGALLAAFRDATGWGGLRLTSVSGTNTITASVAAQGSITMAPSAYSTGMRFRFTPANDNTGATTINVNSLGAKNIFLNGAALVGYELRTNSIVEVEYDGTQFKIIAGAHGDGVPVGTVVPFGGTTAPNGYLFAFGQAISRTTYAALFAVLGTTYGSGDGSTTFNVPDLRGRVVAGQDDMGGSSANRLTDQSGGLNGDTLGATGGAETVTLTTAHLPASGLTVSASGTVATRDDSNQAGSADSVVESISGGNNTVPVSVSGTTSNMGSGGAHNNVQPTIILNYILKH